MAYIKVDHYKLAQSADQIDKYISAHKSSMTKMNMVVSSLSTSWKGDDYIQVQKEWSEIAAPDSTSSRMLESIQNYADSIRSAALKYKEAQARAINRATTLCK